MAVCRCCRRLDQDDFKRVVKQGLVVLSEVRGALAQWAVGCGRVRGGRADMPHGQTHSSNLLSCLGLAQCAVSSGVH